MLRYCRQKHLQKPLIFLCITFYGMNKFGKCPWVDGKIKHLFNAKNIMYIQ